ncbi:uncharacterized protein LOC121415495 [Lytechinus variegatus]|uniref:uncharacterized protein LOC121415495 n=1 Tax=Lytechinus variegatus TaxID=7654 RepID=UPI001BB2160E|nr:uncharacterized protein LOC121415495 [Lytechinus variegatus]
MQASIFYLIFIFKAGFVGLSRGYQSGAPASACVSLTPGHQGTTPSSNPFRYSITTDGQSYQPGGKVTVTISSNTGSIIRGFFIQARPVNQNIPVGFFETRPSTAQHLTCPGGPALNSVTHSIGMSQERMSSVVVGWRAPTSLHSDIQFIVTVVESFTVYWTNRYSDVIRGAGGVYNCPEMFEFSLEKDQSYAIVDLDDVLGQGVPPYDIISGPVMSSPTQLDYSETLRQGVTVTVRMRGAIDTSNDCSFLLILTDNQAPNITCPQNRLLQTSSSDIEVFWPPAVARDNVGLRSSNPIVYSHINGIRLPVSPDPVIITVTAYDTSGNAATCDFRILVGEQGVDDDNLIMIDCPDNDVITFPLDPGKDSSTIDLDIQGRDVNGQPVPIYRTAGPTDVTLPGIVQYSERFREGQRFTFVAEDPTTNEKRTCSFVLKIVDDETPTIECPQNIRVRTNRDTTPVTWSPAQASDNLAASYNITISYSPENGSILEASDPPKMSVITAEASDTFNNVARCQFIASVQKVGAVCPFPSLPNTSAVCQETASGQTQCSVSCDFGFLYVMTSNQFICEMATDGVTYWNPLPNDAMCAEPELGERIYQTVTIRFIIPQETCLNDEDLPRIVRTYIVPQLLEESLCEYEDAKACEDSYIIPHCGGKSGAKKRRQSARTLLDVDIEVSSVVDSNTDNMRVASMEQDVDTLVKMIERHVMESRVTIRIDGNDYNSETDWSVVSSGFTWSCPRGWKITDRGCVPCPRGSYFEETRNICEFCPVEDYQDLPQQTSCKPCTGENIVGGEGKISERGCSSVTPSEPQETTFTSLTAIFVIFCIILCLGILFLVIIGIIYCCMRNTITHHFPSSSRKRSLSKLQYLNQAFESDNETATGPDMRYENNRGTARRNVSRQFSRSSLSTQYGYSQEDPDEVALMNSNFTFGVRDDDGGLMMRPADGSGRSEHGGPDGGESTTSPGSPEESSTSQSPTNQGEEKRGEKVLDESTGEYLWPAPPSPPSPPPPPVQREGETVMDENNAPTTRL